ncbi:MAG: alpha/beta fold hydrolase [Marmoricola sp.]
MAYVDVAGHRIWHEVTGTGPPVALLHGAFGGSSSFAGMAPSLAGHGHRVHVPERPGHMHSPDLDEPLTYGGMAVHTADYLEQVVGEPCDLVGWSDGAVVALLLARDRPELVGRAVLVGQYYNSDGRVPDSPIDAALQRPETFEFLRRGYAEVSPDGADHFRAVFEKTMHMIDTEPEIDLATLAGVAAPTLVLQGDRDEVTVQHSRAVVAALPDARLAVLPGTHLLPLELPDVVNPLLASFLAR